MVAGGSVAHVDCEERDASLGQRRRRSVHRVVLSQVPLQLRLGQAVRVVQDAGVVESNHVQRCSPEEAGKSEVRWLWLMVSQ